MDVQRISATRSSSPTRTFSVADRGSFIGQKPLIHIIRTALKGAKITKKPLGHILLTGPSGHGKTTLARLIGNDMQVNVHHITAYALTKPADIISLLHSIRPNDILFIDELHRCKAIVEEVLYVAMEDFAIDMILPDGKPLRLTLQPFTLIGATTKPELLSAPLKNRFVYKLHFSAYTQEEKEALLSQTLHDIGIRCEESPLIGTMCGYTTNVPREIGNMSKQLYDRLIAHYGNDDVCITLPRREQFWQDYQLFQGGLTPLHHEYLLVLEGYGGRPVGVKTLAVTVGVHEKTIEEEIEPLLLKLKLIEKTARGRTLFGDT